MKKVLIVAFLCVNVALLAAIVIASQPEAQAQGVVGGGHDYLLLTAVMSRSSDVVYVIDLGSQRLAALEFDKTKKKLQAYRGRELKRDFGKRNLADKD